MMVMSSLFNDQLNPVQQLQIKFKESGNWFQDVAVEAVFTSGGSRPFHHKRVQGAFVGGLKGTLSPDMSQTGVDPQAIKQAQALVGGPWVQARNFAAISGVNVGIACVMKRIRGKDDLESLVPIILNEDSDDDDDRMIQLVPEPLCEELEQLLREVRGGN